MTGGCFCGEVRYEAAGECSNSMVCHCQSCRRAAGSPVVAWVTFQKRGVRFTKGSPAEYRSSPPVVRSFCSACGTPLTYRHESYGDAIDITTCSLDEPEKYPPTHHSWLGHDVSWVKFGDGLPAFPQSRPARS
ncbi:MAG: GFA family protein [Burkholderiales bacterium]